MKKIFSWIIALCLLSLPVFAVNSDVPPADDFKKDEYTSLVSSIDDLCEPFVYKNYAVFTASNDSRFVGIAFDFEGFRTIHPFMLRTIRDADNEITHSFYFYILDLPKEVQKLEYRLVADGLWTLDPLNKNVVYNEQSGIRLSYLDVSREIPLVTETPADGTVHFVYKGKSGQHIRLGGSFTNWDSWIYELAETSPGIYEFNLPLPPGKYEYVFYSGMKTLVDKGNPNRCYTQDGREANWLIVKK